MGYSETSAGAFTSLIVLYAQFNMFCSTKARKNFLARRNTGVFQELKIFDNGVLQMTTKLAFSKTGV